jgi:hypothetical protein
MKRMIIFCVVFLAGLSFAGIANAQAMKDIYKSVKKAELSIELRATKSFKDALTDAKTEMDLFKGSDEARKNPEFSRHIEAALESIKKAYGLSWAMDHGFHGQINPKAGAGPGGVENIDKWNNAKADAARELEAAKRYLK